MKRALLLVGDGMSDRPCRELNGLTPLQAAKAPNFERLATEGMNGICDVAGAGIRCGSDTGHLALLGYDPHAVYTGRGPFEALGIGMEVKGGDVAFRCNFSTVDGSGIVLDRRAGRITEGTHELAATMNGKVIDGVTCLVKESVAHRAALILRGEGLSAAISDADPHVEGQPLHEIHALDGSDAAKRTAGVVNQFVRMSIELLSNHPVNVERVKNGEKPANAIVPRGAGMAPHLAPFNERHNVDSACVVETGLVRGIGRFVGMAVCDAPGATGGTDSDLGSVAKTVLDALGKHSFVLCNVKGPDLCGHDNEPDEKVRQVQKIDAMVGTIMQQTGGELYVALLADHSTPCEFGDHSGDPVAVTVWGYGVRRDTVRRHDEISCASGGMLRIQGKDIVPILTQLMGVQEKFGA